MKNSYFIIVGDDEIVFSDSFEGVDEEKIIGQLEEEVKSLFAEGEIEEGQTIEICKRIGEVEVEYEYNAHFVKD